MYKLTIGDYIAEGDLTEIYDDFACESVYASWYLKVEESLKTNYDTLKTGLIDSVIISKMQAELVEDYPEVLTSMDWLDEIDGELPYETTFEALKARVNATGRVEYCGLIIERVV